MRLKALLITLLLSTPALFSMERANTDDNDTFQYLDDLFHTNITPRVKKPTGKTPPPPKAKPAQSGMEAASSTALMNVLDARTDKNATGLSTISTEISNYYYDFFKTESNETIFNAITGFQVHFSTDLNQVPYLTGWNNLLLAASKYKWNHLLHAARSYLLDSCSNEKRKEKINDAIDYLDEISQFIGTLPLNNQPTAALCKEWREKASDLREYWASLMEYLDEVTPLPQPIREKSPQWLSQINEIIQNHIEKKKQGNEIAFIESLQQRPSHELAALIDNLRIKLSMDKEVYEFLSPCCLGRLLLSLRQVKRDIVYKEELKHIPKLIHTLRIQHRAITPLDYQLIQATKEKDLAILISIATMLNSAQEEMINKIEGEMQLSKTTTPSAPEDPILPVIPVTPETAPSFEIGDTPIATTLNSSQEEVRDIMGSDVQIGKATTLSAPKNPIPSVAPVTLETAPSQKIIDTLENQFLSMQNLIANNPNFFNTQEYKNFAEMLYILEGIQVTPLATTEDVLLLKGTISRAYEIMKKGIAILIHRELTEEERSPLVNLFIEFSKKYDSANDDFESLLPLFYKEKKISFDNPEEEETMELNLDEIPTSIAQPMPQSPLPSESIVSLLPQIIPSLVPPASNDQTLTPPPAPKAPAPAVQSTSETTKEDVVSLAKAISGVSLKPTKASPQSQTKDTVNPLYNSLRAAMEKRREAVAPKDKPKEAIEESNSKEEEEWQ